MLYIRKTKPLITIAIDMEIINLNDMVVNQITNNRQAGMSLRKLIVRQIAIYIYVNHDKQNK